MTDRIVAADVKAAYAILDRLLLYIAREIDPRPQDEDFDFDLEYVQVEVLEAFEALESALGVTPH